MSKLLLLPFLVVIACTSQTTPDSESTENPTGTPPSTTTKLSEASVEDLASVDTTNIAPDSSLYIGEVSIFRETGEIYTSVSYHEIVNTEGVFDYLQKQADSVIYEDAEIQRARIPISVARTYFNLCGLDTISVYHNAEYVGDAVFVRVEYMEDVIEGQFIAVFIPVKKIIFPDEVDYCISTRKHQYKTIDVTYREIKDDELTSKLIDTFVLHSAEIWRVLHTRVEPYQSVYSAISMHSRLLLIETRAGESRILMDLKEDWFISDITPLHLESNGKPMLLLRMGMNETDMMWTAVAVFSGEEYVFGEGNRF